MTSYKVLSPLSLDNLLYEVGDTVELTADQAIDLTPDVIEPLPAEAAAKQ